MVGSYFLLAPVLRNIACTTGHYFPVHTINNEGYVLIIVLTLGRSGSSLVMQTLSALGCQIVGRKFDEHDDPDRQRRHVRLNPLGYFEEPEIYYGGPRSEAFQRVLRSGCSAKACKMDIRHLVDEKQLPAWQASASGISGLIVSFREPSEQAYSEWLTCDASQVESAAKRKFAFISNFLVEYRSAMEAIDGSAGGAIRLFAPKLHLIDFAEAKEPVSYVERIRSLSGLEPEPDQIAAAISNISPDLFRVKRDDLASEEHLWAEKLAARDVYRSLVSRGIPYR